MNNLDAIDKMVRNGADDKEIAKKVGVSAPSFSSYLSRGSKAADKKRNGEDLNEKETKFLKFFETYARARQTPDEVVESALFLSCQDRTIPKTTIIKRYDPQGNLIYIEEKTEHVPVAASVPAQQFYLANKKRKDWEYKPDPAKQTDSKETEAVIIVAREKLEVPKDE